MSRRAWILLLAALPAAGCAISQPQIPVDDYLDGKLAPVRAFADQQVADGPPENLALVLNVLGQCELELGDIDAARRSFLRAAQIMGTWAVSGGEATAAIVGSESSKTYKGDPYEKAMNAFYLAYCYLEKGEPDNARAALKRGILADAEVDDEKYQDDNALLFWMAGRMSLLAGSSGAADYFEEARKANAFAIKHKSRGTADNPVLEHPKAGNLVLLLPIGLGPQKYATGHQQSLARFRAQKVPPVGARASLDGRNLGRSWILSDVDFQAMTRGGTAMEGIRKGKAVFKTSAEIAGIALLDDSLSEDNHNSAATKAIVGGGLLALAMLTATSADTRYWPTLPSTVQVLTAKVPPGQHELTIDFVNRHGHELPALRHVMTVTIPKSGETWVLCPSIPQHPKTALQLATEATPSR